MTDGFQRTLDHIRSIADSEAEKGRLFERLMKTYFIKDPLYMERFSEVWLWSEWADLRPDFEGTDTGIDLVAEERQGGYCAIQCKCYAPGTQISKPHLDSFISASARDPFTARIVVDTGDGWGPNAVKTITPLKPACTVLRFGDLASRPFDWPDLIHDKPEDLSFRHEPFSLRPHQKVAFDDVTGGFNDHDRGKLIMACGTGKTFAALRIAEAVAGIGGRIWCRRYRCSSNRCGNGRRNGRSRIAISGSAPIHAPDETTRTRRFRSLKSRSPRTPRRSPRRSGKCVWTR